MEQNTLYAQKQYADPAGAPRPGPVSPFYQASETFSRAEGLARRVREIVERLCGEAVPTGPSGARPSNPARPGIFGAVEATCESVNEQIDVANAALNRLEAELP